MLQADRRSGRFICDECVDVCGDIIDEQLLRLADGDEAAARAMSTDRLLHYVEHAKNGEQRAMRIFPQDQVKRFEQALRTAMPVLSERKQ